MQHRMAAVPREPNMAIPKKSRAVHGHSGLLDKSLNSGGSDRELTPDGDTVSGNMYKCLNYSMSGVKRFRS